MVVGSDAVTTESVVTAAATKPRPLVLALLAEVRPKQWVKNLLVFAALVSAGMAGEADAALDAGLAFVCFCLVSSGTYIVNDLLDMTADRLHPTKRYRPIAAGEVPVAVARVLGPVLMICGLGVGLLSRWEVSVVAAAYLAVTITYSFRLKHVPVIDIVAVASGFALRAIAGIAAINIPISNWFFILAVFGSLFMVSGKRQAESLTMGDQASAVRSTLATYSDSYLAYLRSVTSGVVLVAYCLWAFEKAAATDARIPWFQLSIVPFGVAILRYALLIDAGRGGAPEDLVFSERTLQICGVVWVATFAAGVYL